MIQKKTVFASIFESDAETASWALPDGAVLVGVHKAADQSECDRNEVLLELEFTAAGE